jgi:Tfp pilus assembly protein PilV
MDRFRLLMHRLIDRLRPQDGSMLIEVMIGAVMVVIVSGAVLNGLEGAQDTGESNKARSTSASLAQQDQERMRAMPVDELSNYRNTRPVDVAGATYTVESRSDWVRDSNGVVSCTNDSSQAQYMKITSTVTSNVNQDVPLKQTSLVSPPRGTFGPNIGTAAVQVVDRDQNPLAGVRVDITGPQSLTDVTNSLGCVVFGYIPEGPWRLEISSLGLIGWNGDSPVRGDVGVVGGTTVLTKLELDQPSSIDATFETKVGSDAPIPARSKSVSVANSRLPSPGSKPFTSAVPVPSLTANSLYPFLDGYGVYAGSCEANNPSKPPTNIPDYFANAGASAFVVTDPGGNSDVVVRMPAINVQVMDSTGSAPVPGASVKVTQEDANCTEAYPTRLTDSSGAMIEPGFPFGTYTVCAEFGGQRSIVTGVSNTDHDGVTVPPMPLSAPGSCP